MLQLLIFNIIVKPTGFCLQKLAKNGVRYDTQSHKNIYKESIGDTLNIRDAVRDSLLLTWKTKARINKLNGIK